MVSRPSRVVVRTLLLLVLATGAVALGLLANGLAQPTSTAAAEPPVNLCYNRTGFQIRYVNDITTCTAAERPVQLTQAGSQHWVCPDPASGGVLMKVDPLIRIPGPALDWSRR